MPRTIMATVNDIAIIANSTVRIVISMLRGDERMKRNASHPGEVGVAGDAGAFGVGAAAGVWAWVPSTLTGTAGVGADSTGGIAAATFAGAGC